MAVSLNVRHPVSLQLIGGGGHALVVAEAAEQAGFRVEGFFDDRESPILAETYRRLGTITEAIRAYDGKARIIAVGDLELRAWIQGRYRGALATVIHPAAIVSPTATIGEGSYLAPGAIINAAAVIGAHAIINTRAVVEHNCILGDNVHLGPGATLGGSVRVGSSTLIGINACVKPSVEIGDGCVIGAGAVAIRSAPDRVVLIGVPARQLKSSDLRPKADDRRRIA